MVRESDLMADRDAGGATLKRHLTTPLLYVFILGDILGAAVYVLVGQVAEESGGAVWLPLIVAFLLALVPAMSYAVLVTKYPRAGGASQYVHKAFGPFCGFVIGHTARPGG